MTSSKVKIVGPVTGIDKPTVLLPSKKRINTLKEGTRFKDELGNTGTLLYANQCRARVQMDSAPKVEEFDAKKYNKKTGEETRVHVKITKQGKAENRPPDMMVEVL